MKDTTPRSRLNFDQWCVLAIVAGLIFLTSQSLDRVLALSPKHLPNLNPFAGSLAALGLAALGLAGVCWKRVKSLFSRWSNNKSAIFLDALLFGTTAGVALNYFWEGLWNGRWQPGWLVPALAFLAASVGRLQHLSRNRPQDLALSQTEANSSVDEALPDLTAESDAFGRTQFVSTLTQAIQQCDPAICHVFGLVGPWGSGKTTVINALVARSAQHIHVVRIDSWAFRDTGRLTEAVLTSLVKAIDEHYFLPDLKKIVARYLSIISPVAKNVPVLEAIAKSLAGAEELQSLKSRLENAVSATHDRFLVIIDDVDRLDKAEFQSLLKTVRLCASIPRIIYVLAYDRQSIYKLVADGDPALARDFMDKVVEDEWVLPLIPHEKLRNYLTRHLPDPGSSRPERFARDFQERLKGHFAAIRQLLRTPRQIKRAGIALSRRSSLVTRLNPFDVFVWDVLRQRQPILHEFISQRPWLLRPDDGLEADWVIKVLLDKENREKDVKAIEELIAKSGEDAESVRDLFWELFPKEPHSSQKAEAEELRLRRICNSRYFDTYFFLDSGEDLRRPEEIDSLVAEVNGAVSGEHAASLVSASIDSALKSDWLQSWVALMRVYCEELNVEKIRPIISANLRFANQQSKSLNREMAEAIRSLVELNIDQVLRFNSDTEATAATIELVTQTANLPFAGVYLRSLEQRGRGFNQAFPDQKRLSAAFDARLERDLMALGTSVFDQTPSELGTLIFRYSDKQKLWSFLEATAAGHPKYWSQIVFNFVDHWSDGSWAISDERLPEFPQSARQKAFSAISGASLTELPDYLRKAAEVFLNWHPRSTGRGPNPDLE